MFFFRMRRPPAAMPEISVSGGFSPPLRVAQFISTRRGDAERGPEVRMRREEATMRLLLDGELARVETPRRQEIATVRIDDAVAAGDAVVRDMAGVALSEVIRVRKIDLDAPPRHLG